MALDRTCLSIPVELKYITMKHRSRIFNILNPLATSMVLMGLLFGGLAFFGGAPHDPFSQNLFDNRWWFVVESCIGLALLITLFNYKNS